MSALNELLTTRLRLFVVQPMSHGQKIIPLQLWEKGWMVKCVSFSSTSDTSRFVSLINPSGGCEVFDCISLNAAACCGPVCVTLHCIAPNTPRRLVISPAVKGRSKSRCMCERVVLGKGAKVLISESAEGTCPPHHGRRS